MYIITIYRQDFYPIVPLQTYDVLHIYVYCVQPNKHKVCLKKWAMKKCQGICSYKPTTKFVSLHNKVAV